MAGILRIERQDTDEKFRGKVNANFQALSRGVVADGQTMQVIQQFAGIDETARATASQALAGLDNKVSLGDARYLNQPAFVYILTKQDTGRRTRTGQVIWGREISGTVSAAANATAIWEVLPGLNSNSMIIEAKGWWAREGTVLTTSTSPIVDFVRSTASLSFISTSDTARINSPWIAWIDWTDGTQAP